jgi:hypothetical protein
MLEESEYVYLKSKDIAEIRESLLLSQDGRCALCSCKITDKTGVSLDHQHKNKSDEIGEDGGGLIRGVLCRSCNVLEGKLWNAMKRFLQVKNVQERINWLENLILYYKQPNLNLVHPNEIPKEPKIGKREFNKINKYYKEKYPNRKPLEYPKSKKYTKTLLEIKNEMENNNG